MAGRIDGQRPPRLAAIAAREETRGNPFVRKKSGQGQGDGGLAGAAGGQVADTDHRCLREVEGCGASAP
jgi:hypothetical protein